MKGSSVIGLSCKLVLLYSNRKSYVRVMIVLVICGDIELFTLARPSIGHTASECGSLRAEHNKIR